MRREWIWWGLVCIWCILIFTITASPTSTSEHTNSIVKSEIKAAPQTVSQINLILRKLAHGILFGGLAFLILLALGKRQYAGLYAWLLATFYGATDEVHQSFMPGRTPALLDVGFDSLGALFAVLLYFSVKWMAAKSAGFFGGTRPYKRP